MAAKKKKKRAGKQAKTVRKKAAKRARVARPRRAAARAPSVLVADETFAYVRAMTEDVRTRVVAIMASVCGTSADKVGALCLSDLTSPCNLILRGRTASELNSEWPALMPPFKPTDVACADTADTLSHQVRQRLP